MSGLNPPMPTPTDMVWHVPPECGGQIVETAYALDICGVYRRTTDRSDGTVTYEIADWEACYRYSSGGLQPVEPWNDEPAIPDAAWRPAAAPDGETVDET